MRAVEGLFLWLMLAPLYSAFLYQSRIAAFGLRVRPLEASGDELSFGVIVPAYNEERTIGKLLVSLKGLEYPVEKLLILVVADHCADATARLVREAGFKCLERSAGPRGKAASLSEGIAWIEEHRPGIAAVAFFDADTVVQADFFRIMSGLVRREPYLQAHVGIDEWDATVFTRLDYINAMVENRFRELARSQAGLSCHLRGHGMVFRRDVLEGLSWQDGGMVEDLDMQLRLVIGGRRVVWVDQARVHTVLPKTAAEAKVQRQRWAGGKSAIVRQGVAMLYKSWRKSRSPIVFDQMALLLLPSHSVQLALVFVAVLVTAALGGPGYGPLWASLALLGMYFAYFLTGAVLNGVRFATFMTLPLAPFFIIWRTWVYLTSLKGSKRWR